ncbi:hypothetical protein HID58_018306, partial [Brassica napus]
MESPWFLDNLIFFILRPLLATSFIVCFIALWWFLAWKLVLSHVPLVQEIFGLRHKTFIPKPESRGRISKFYKSITSSQNHELNEQEANKNQAKESCRVLFEFCN